MSLAHRTDVSSSLSNLSLEHNKTAASKPKPKPKPMSTKKSKKKVVVDSWEDEDLTDVDSNSEMADDAPEESAAPQQQVPPPPEPSLGSAGYGGDSWASPAATADSSSSVRRADPDKRPEKTDAVARRMIAAGLGLKAPRLTDEQRAYQKSVREQEKKKRELERAAEQKKKDDAERAKAAMWDD